MGRSTASLPDRLSRLVEEHPFPTRIPDGEAVRDSIQQAVPKSEGSVTIESEDLLSEEEIAESIEVMQDMLTWVHALSAIQDYYSFARAKVGHIMRTYAAVIKKRSERSSYKHQHAIRHNDLPGREKDSVRASCLKSAAVVWEKNAAAHEEFRLPLLNQYVQLNNGAKEFFEKHANRVGKVMYFIENSQQKVPKVQAKHQGATSSFPRSQPAKSVPEDSAFPHAFYRRSSDDKPPFPELNLPPNAFETPLPARYPRQDILADKFNWTNLLNKRVPPNETTDKDFGQVVEHYSKKNNAMIRTLEDSIIRNFAIDLTENGYGVANKLIREIGKWDGIGGLRHSALCLDTATPLGSESSFDTGKPSSEDHPSNEPFLDSGMKNEAHSNSGGTKPENTSSSFKNTSYSSNLQRDDGAAASKQVHHDSRQKISSPDAQHEFSLVDDVPQSNGCPLLRHIAVADENWAAALLSGINALSLQYSSSGKAGVTEPVPSIDLSAEASNDTESKASTAPSYGVKLPDSKHSPHTTFTKSSDEESIPEDTFLESQTANAKSKPSECTRLPEEERVNLSPEIKGALDRLRVALEDQLKYSAVQKSDEIPVLEVPQNNENVQPQLDDPSATVSSVETHETIRTLSTIKEALEKIGIGTPVDTDRAKKPEIRNFGLARAPTISDIVEEDASSPRKTTANNNDTMAEQQPQETYISTTCFPLFSAPSITSGESGRSLKRTGRFYGRIDGYYVHVEPPTKPTSSTVVPSENTNGGSKSRNGDKARAQSGKSKQQKSGGDGANNLRRKRSYTSPTPLVELDLDHLSNGTRRGSLFPGPSTENMNDAFPRSHNKSRREKQHAKRSRDEILLGPEDCIFDYQPGPLQLESLQHSRLTQEDVRAYLDNLKCYHRDQGNQDVTGKRKRRHRKSENNLQS